MRVLMTADTVGGVWTFSLQLARRIAARGIHTALATMGHALTDAQWLQVGEHPNLSVHESGFRLEWMQEPWDDVTSAGEWLLELERRLSPDIIHLNNYAHGTLRWKAPVLMVGHSCVFSWWHAVRRDPPPAAYDRYKEAVRAGLEAADAIVAPSHFMLSELRRHYGALPRADVIYNGADAECFTPRPKEPLVLTAGRLWDEAKNVQAAIRAADRLPWPLLLAGDTRHPDGWTVDVGGIRHLGTLPPQALARWYAVAAIYLFPARYEPFGLSVLEAALSGCALVLGDIPSLRELWEDAALFVPPDDVDAIVDAVNRLTRDSALRRELGERARAAALPRTAEKSADAYWDHYRKLNPASTLRIS